MSEPSSQTKKTILLSVGGMSAQHLPTYGNNWIETPGINRLANRSEVFEFAFANQTNEGTVVAVAEEFAVPNASVLLTDCGESISSSIQQKFSDVISLNADEATGLAEELEQTQLAQVFAQIIDHLQVLLQSDTELIWIELQGMFGAWDAPYAARESFVEEDDPDPPFFFQPPNFDLRAEKDVDPDTILGIQQSFAAQMLVFDTCLGVLLDELNLESNSNLVFALTSPKGFPLGEHRIIGIEQANLFSESIHVPWIVHNSSFPPTVFRHQNLFGTESIMNSFLGLMNRVGNDDSVFLESQASELIVRRIRTDEATIRVTRTRAWLLVEADDQARLFVKPDDRCEFNDVSSRRSDVVHELQQIANEWEAAESAGDSFDVKLEDHLIATWGR